MDLRLDLEEREQIVEVEGLAGDGREARQKPFEKIAQPAKRAGEERQAPMENWPASVRHTM
jgi:hypothetical protein